MSSGFKLTVLLGAIILQERTLRNISQVQLASDSRVHAVALSRIERGKQGDIGVETLHRLAMGLCSSAGRPVTAAGLLTRAEQYRARLGERAELVSGAALVALIALS